MLRDAFSRRQFLGRAVGAAASLTIPACAAKRRPAGRDGEPLFEISLAQWSLHRTLRRGDLDHLDFVRTAHQDYGIDADGEGVRSLLIMCDAEGRLSEPDGIRATKALLERVRDELSESYDAGSNRS